MTRPDDDLDDILDLDRRGTMAMRGRWGNGVGMSGCKQKSWRTSRKYAGRSFRTGADLEGDPVANDDLGLRAKNQASGHVGSVTTQAEVDRSLRVPKWRAAPTDLTSDDIAIRAYGHREMRTDRIDFIKK